VNNLKSKLIQVTDTTETNSLWKEKL